MIQSGITPEQTTEAVLPPTSPTAVIVVNYGTADLTIAAVASVLRLAPADVTVHVVDNASPGEDAATLAAAAETEGWGPRVTLWPETENHGFGRGNNLVLRHLARQEPPCGSVLLLNPDARLENDVVTLMRAVLEANPAVGMVGAGIAKPCGTPVTAAFRFPGIAWSFAEASRFGPVSRLLRRWQVPLPPDHPEGPVDWVAGAALLCRMQTLREIDFFDPAFFLYYEEVDLMRRAAEAGWRTWYLPRARVIHAEGAATGVRSGETRRRRRPAYWYESWQLYHRRALGRTGALLSAAACLSGTALHHGLATLRRRPVYSPLNVFEDFWRYAIRPLLSRKEDATR